MAGHRGSSAELTPTQAAKRADHLESLLRERWQHATSPAARLAVGKDHLLAARRAHRGDPVAADRQVEALALDLVRAGNGMLAELRKAGRR